MKEFIKDALSDVSGASSKRVIAFLAFVGAVIIFLTNLFFSNLHVEFMDYFHTLLIFSGGLLGVATLEKFKTPN